MAIRPRAAGQWLIGSTLLQPKQSRKEAAAGPAIIAEQPILHLNNKRERLAETLKPLIGKNDSFRRP